jgi:LmbE family N-acetylglucosaminyl deacetylase
LLIAGAQALQSVSKVLCLGAHSDDIELGCAGTLLKLRRLNPLLSVTFIVFSANGDRIREARDSVEALMQGAGKVEVAVESFRECYFAYEAGIKDYFNELAERARPDLVFTHYRHDLHQDHRAISELTWNTFRDHLILEYEIPKYDGDLGAPNVFVHLERSICEQKVDHLMRCFRSQDAKPWFSRETFMATLRLRGIESRSPEGFAEGFYGRKVVLA